MCWKPISDANIQRAYRIRITLFLIGALLLVLLLTYLYSGFQTLNALGQIERERDQWQRPADVIQALNLREGSVVVDLGSGVGYFALRLSPVVGKRGRVMAVDILKEPLAFLWVRSFMRNQHNIDIIYGYPDNPRLPTDVADGVLLANTYHEFAQPMPILDHLFQSLKPGGRLVIVDHGPRTAGGQSREIEGQHHELRPELVEPEVRHAGLEIISRQDHFIDQPNDDHVWWLIVSQKP
jgi:predicted methyltransferase